MARDLVEINGGLYLPRYLADSSQQRIVTATDDPVSKGFVPAVGDIWAQPQTLTVTPPSKLPMLIGMNQGSGHDWAAYDTIYKNNGAPAGLQVRRTYQENNGGWPVLFGGSAASTDYNTYNCASVISFGFPGTWATLASGNGGTERTNWIAYFNSCPNDHRMWISLGHENDNDPSAAHNKYNVAFTTQKAAQANLRAALAASNKANSPYFRLGVILTNSGYATYNPADYHNLTPGVLDWTGNDAYFYYEPDFAGPHPNASDYPYPASDYNQGYTLANMTPVHRYGDQVAFADANGLGKLCPEWNAHPDRSSNYRPNLIRNLHAYFDTHNFEASLIFNSAGSGQGNHVPWWSDAYTDWSNRPASNSNFSIKDQPSIDAYVEGLNSHAVYSHGMLG